MMIVSYSRFSKEVTSKTTENVEQGRLIANPIKLRQLDKTTIKLPRVSLYSLGPAANVHFKFVGPTVGLHLHSYAGA